MRLTLTASLVLCGLSCTGCESLNKTAHWPNNKTPAVPEQLANDLQRREAAAKQVAHASRPEKTGKEVQQTNFAPGNAAPTTELDALLLQAKQAEDAQQNQVAGALYEQVLIKQPQHAEAQHRLGVLADKEGRYPEAQQHYRLALQQDPQNASLMSDIGYSYYSQDRLDEAEQYLTSALQIQPQNQFARNNLAHVYGRRAQQTGSAADYKLAQEQFMLALGPQGAEQQMKQFFPQAQGAAPDQKRGLPNPFQQKGDKTVARAGSKLQAPSPKKEKLDGNQELARQMEQIRLQMEASRQIPPRRSDHPADRNPSARGSPIPTANIPFSQLNNALSQIDYEATQQQHQIQRQNYPVVQRGGNPAARPGWTPQGGVEPVGGSNDPQAPALRPIDHFAQNGGNAADGNDRSRPPPPNAMLEGSPGAWDQAPNSDARFRGQRDDRRPDLNPLYNRGTPDQYQSGPVGQMNNPNPNPAAGEESAPGFSEQSWPATRVSFEQVNPRGSEWDGKPIVNDFGNGRDSNSAYVPNDPTYRTGNGQPFGAQRPTGSPRANPNGTNRDSAPAWDDGREAAAQLGLDAGMGEMFPSGTGQPMNGQMQRGDSPTGRRNGPADRQRDTFMTADPYLQPTATTPRGMAPGGNGQVSPADYNYSTPDFENRQYSRGVTPAMGENYGSQGEDVSAPWNPSGTMQRNSRPALQSQQSQWGNEGGTSQGRFAPTRQSNTAPQNFGAPPMYFGR